MITTPIPTLLVEVIAAQVRVAIGETLAHHGFRPAKDVDDAWVRPCCDGILQVAHVSWVLRVSHVAVIATLGFGYHVIEAEELYAAVLRQATPASRYSEAHPTLHVRLDALLPRGARREWLFPRTSLPEAELDALREVAGACVVRFLALHRTREAVFAELERQYAAAKAPQFVTHLRFACREAVFGRRDQAIARVEAALAALAARDHSESTEADRRAGAEALARLRSRGS
jgi:hypothetical protein